MSAFGVQRKKLERSEAGEPQVTGMTVSPNDGDARVINLPFHPASNVFQAIPDVLCDRSRTHR